MHLTKNNSTSHVEGENSIVPEKSSFVITEEGCCPEKDDFVVAEGHCPEKDGFVFVEVCSLEKGSLLLIVATGEDGLSGKPVGVCWLEL